MPGKNKAHLHDLEVKIKLKSVILDYDLSLR